MSLRGLVRLARRTGRISEPAAPPPPALTTASVSASVSASASLPVSAADDERPGQPFTPPAALRGSAQVRHVDAGSCNGCEIELAAAFGPVYDAERYGVRLVASPRHADVVLVTGVVTANMAEPLRLTVAATPRPRVVVACGDCALGRGAFHDGYAVVGGVHDVVPVDLQIPGCPPEPDAIVAALRRVTGR